jgi:lipid II:glycine glycyltransferase (peptidoglycan interpeptide bridge formation enzyme)
MENRSFIPVDGGFLQSKQWEKFQNKIGRKTFRTNEGGLTCLAIKYELSIVSGYFFIPRGPIRIRKLKFENQGNAPKLKIHLNRLIKIAKKNNVGWIRIEPQSFEDLEDIKRALGGKYVIKKSKKDHEPAQTLLIDLRQDEENILAAMKPKTRYNIRLSNKKGVGIYSSRRQEDIKSFLSLLNETAKRDRIKNHPDDYYLKMLKTISEKDLKLFLAKANGQVIAGAVVAFYNQTATYLHGASSDSFRNLMAPFGLQWTVIKEAKQRGFKFYDLGGVSLATKNYPEPKKNWAGISRFKIGFCPTNQPVDFPGCWDIILDEKKYGFYRFLQKIKEFVK